MFFMFVIFIYDSRNYLVLIDGMPGAARIERSTIVEII